MSVINLYKVENKEGLLKNLNEKMALKGSTDVSYPSISGTIKAQFYLSLSDDKKSLPWAWILKEFSIDEVEVTSLPKGVLYLEIGPNQNYAVSFGYSYFLIDKFCDRDFGFDFARKIKYKKIKTTTLTSPNYKKNKTVNTYIDYDELDYDSGESFAKLKAVADFEDGFNIFKPTLEMGTSIKLGLTNLSIKGILDSVFYIDGVIKNSPDIYRIPLFKIVRDEDLKNKLETSLRKNINTNLGSLTVSELDVIGATEVFNHSDCLVELSYKGRLKKKTQVLDEEVISQYCKENSISNPDDILGIKIKSFDQLGISTHTKRLKDVISYVDDVNRCVLDKGVWYEFNDDYLNYLDESIYRIEAIYDPKYDFLSTDLERYRDEKFIEERNLEEYRDKEESEIKKKINEKYYAEKVFNEIRERDDGFVNYDRNCQRICKCSVEIMDLYNPSDKSMCAVKIGANSAKLCYVVDQSLHSVLLYKKSLTKNIPEIKVVVIWIVLEKRSHIEDENGRPDLRKLEMLLLKNRLVHWQKEILLNGMTPKIYINYRK